MLSNIGGRSPITDHSGRSGMKFGVQKSHRTTINKDHELHAALVDDEELKTSNSNSLSR